MSEKKVFIEQSVLVGASIVYFSEEIGVTIKDDFNDICKELFDYIKKNIEKEIGIITDFVIFQHTSIFCSYHK